MLYPSPFWSPAEYRRMVETVWLHRARHIVMQGAVIKADADVKNNRPLPTSKSAWKGPHRPSYKVRFLRLFQDRTADRRQTGRDGVPTISSPKYRPLDAREVIGNQLYVVSLTPLRAPITPTHP